MTVEQHTTLLQMKFEYYNSCDPNMVNQSFAEFLICKITEMNKEMSDPKFLIDRLGAIIYDNNQEDAGKK